MKRLVLVILPVGLSFIKNLALVARVEGISMQPEFNPQPETPDYIFLKPSRMRSFQISRGDIVTLTSPSKPNTIIVKRIVGLENDVVHTKGYITETIKVPEGHIWVEGDNTGHSFDSNMFGPVPLNSVTGKAESIIWPPSRWRSLNSKKDEKILL